jgi:hypothetical protein
MGIVQERPSLESERTMQVRRLLRAVCVMIPLEKQMKPKNVLHWLEGKIVYSLGSGDPVRKQFIDEMAVQEDPENFPSLLVTLADTRARIWGPAS